MKRVQFIFLFVLISIAILYSKPAVENVQFAGFACTAPVANIETPSENSDSCNKEVPIEYVYDEVNTKDWKVELVSGTPTVLIPRGGQTTSAPIYAGKKSGSTSDCAYFTFKFQRGEEELSAELQNIPSQNYVNENGKEICAYDIAQFRDQVITSYFGDATDAKLIIPDTVRTHEPYSTQQNNFVSDGFYVKDETLTTDSQCPADYEQTFEFVDNSGTTIKHCLSRTAFSQGVDFVYDSYLINTSVYDAAEICSGGGIVSGAVFRASNNQFAVLCVDKKVSEDESQLIINSLITENNCPDGFAQSSEIELNNKIIRQCISSKTAQIKDSERAAKRTDSLSHLDIDVCPDLVFETREDTCPNGCCPTQTCEVNIPQGPEETFGFILEPSNNCLIKEANQNSDGRGLPITNNENEFIQEGIDQCMETNSEEDTSAECGNNLLEDEEECEIESSSSFFFIGSGAKRIVQRNLENSCSIYDSKYSSGILDCSSNCKIDLSKCAEITCGNGVLETGEECDDGNVLNGDGCDVNCKWESKDYHGDVYGTVNLWKWGQLYVLVGGEVFNRDNEEGIIKMDADLLKVKGKDKLPEKAIFQVSVQGTAFEGEGAAPYINVHTAIVQTVYTKIAKNSPRIANLLKTARQKGQFVGYGYLIEPDITNTKIQSIFDTDQKLFITTSDKELSGWFEHSVILTETFNADGSASISINSKIRDVGNNLLLDSKTYRIENVPADVAQEYLLEMIERLVVLKGQTGKQTQTNVPSIDIKEIRDLDNKGKLRIGISLPWKDKGSNLDIKETDWQKITIEELEDYLNEIKKTTDETRPELGYSDWPSEFYA